MADTAHKTDKEKQQFFDSEEVLEKKINKLANLIFESKHFIAFTGAGISTACGIPDFRSGVNTILKTGPGAWEKKAQKVENKPNKNIVEMAKAIPSFTHMTLVALEEAGYLKYLVSQNTDGLHIRSGFNPEKLAQLHGNRCLEKCKKCGSQFLRDFRTRQAGKVHEHQTSRKCQKCNGKLYDSIINFGQNLPEYEIDRAFQESEKADLCLAMGSSLTVTPAAHVVRDVSKKGKIVIINLQSTPYDKIAHLRINGMCEDVMKRLAKKMELKVRDFILKRIVNFSVTPKKEFEFRGIDKRGVPFSFFKKAYYVRADKQATKEELKGEPYHIDMEKKAGTLRIQFYGYIGEPSLQFPLKQLREGTLELEYDPKVGDWTRRQWIEKNAEKPKVENLD